jgi:hypothetical protein
VDEDEAREQRREEQPTSPQHEKLGDVDGGDIEDEDADQRDRKEDCGGKMKVIR